MFSSHNLTMLTLGAVSAICFAVDRATAEETQGRPNVVLFVSDDHGWRDSGVYGNSYIQTPNMDRLASEGMKFNHAYSASPLCTPSRCVIQSGLMPHRNGGHKFGGTINLDVKTMAEYFNEIGYYTAHVGKWHQAPEDRFPYDHRSVKHSKDNTKFLASYDKPKPLFLVVCSHPPHLPWPPAGKSSYEPSEIPVPPNFVDTPTTRVELTRYYHSVSQMDTFLGGVLGTIDKKGMKDNTLVLLTTDQGAHLPFAKWCVYDAGLHAPLIARWPGKIAPGSTVDAMVSHADILPTLLDAVGGSVPENIDGRSYLAVLKGDRTTHRDVVFGTHTGNTVGSKPAETNDSPARTIRTPTHRYIVNLNHERLFTNHITSDPTPNKPNRYLKLWNEWVETAKTDPAAKKTVERYQHRPKEELYDLTNDPYEMNNLADDPSQAELVKSLKKQLADWCKAQGDTLALEHLTDE